MSSSSSGVYLTLHLKLYQANFLDKHFGLSCWVSSLKHCIVWLAFNMKILDCYPSMRCTLSFIVCKLAFFSIVASFLKLEWVHLFHRGGDESSPVIKRIQNFPLFFFFFQRPIMMPFSTSRALIIHHKNLERQISDLSD